MFPKHRIQYAAKATWYQSKALPVFRSVIGNVTNDNCSAIVAFTHFLVIYTLASEDAENEFLISQSGSETCAVVIPFWLDWLRGSCTVLCDEGFNLLQGPLGPLMMVWVPHLLRLDSKSEIILELFTNINALSAATQWPAHEGDLYTRAAVDLASAFVHLDASQASPSLWDVLHLWALVVPDEYLDLLAKGHPGALILLANYCCLLKKLCRKWYVGSLGERLFKCIQARLDTQYHPWLNVLPPTESSGYSLFIESSRPIGSQGLVASATGEEFSPFKYQANSVH
ncbi:MAG: hypothetical protein MMC23_004546 [Stictis urceolatum]|nr:hypothetical protein [Stictis urceolata]